MFKRLVPVVIAAMLLISMFKVGMVNVYGGGDYVDIVEKYIKDLLKYAEEKGIELPEGLRAKANKALDYINLARNTDNEYLAYKYAVQATIEFAPVYIYLEREVRFDIRKLPGDYVDAINVRLEALRRFRTLITDMLRYNVMCMEMATYGCVSVDVNTLMDKISSLEDQLASLLDNIDSYSIEEIENILKNVDTEIMNIQETINGAMKSEWRGMGIYRAASIVSTLMVYKVIRAINLSITLINQDRIDQAIQVLSNLRDEIDVYLYVVNKSRLYAQVKGIATPGVSKISEDLQKTLKKVKGYIEAAIDALNLGDTMSALSSLESALNELKAYINRHGADKIMEPSEVEVVMAKVDDLMKKLRERFDRIILGNLEAIRETLRNIEQRIQDLVNKYESGQIPKEAFLMALNAIKMSLKAMKSRLKDIPNMDQTILDEIDRLLNWVNQLIGKYS